MSMISPTRNAGVPRSKAKKERLPSFQQLQQAKNKSTSAASADTTKAIAPNPISPTSTADTTEEDMDMISTTPIISFTRLQQQQQNQLPHQHQRHGSDSLSQWNDDVSNDNGIVHGNSYNSVTPQQIGRLPSMKELDIALNGVACNTNDEDDTNINDVSYRNNSEANYSMGGETAVTGNMSAYSTSNTPFLGRRVTPRSTSTSKSNVSSCRDESPEPNGGSSASRRLFMCGAVDVTTEIKGSFQDVNDTVRQIITAVRKFGPDEKDAVKDTLKDAQSYMKQKVLAAILSKNRCGGGATKSYDEDDNEDEDEDLRATSPRRRDRDAVHDVRRRHRRRERREERAEHDELAHASEEVVYDKSSIGMDKSELERLKVFEC